MAALRVAAVQASYELYVAVRGIGGTGARAHVHIADSVPAVSLVKCRFRRSVGM
jgi:hypothetical protein